jgi:hypothetical protein
MERVSAASDNAAMESFLARLQKNVLDKKRWDTHDELRREIVHWIEGTYQRRGRKAAQSKITPSNSKEYKN